MSDDSCAEVAYMEGLGNVGRGIVEHDCFSKTLVRSAEVCALSCNAGKNIFCEKFCGGEKVDVAANDLRFFNAGGKVIRNMLEDSCRDLRGSGAECAGELEARKRQVAHSVIRGIFKHTDDLFFCDSCRRVKSSDAFCKRGSYTVFEFSHIFLQSVCYVEFKILL